MKYLLAGLLILAPQLLFSQQPAVLILQNNVSSSFRGLSVPSDSVVWVSGSNGTIGRSVNGGKNWRWIRVPGHERRDFRDIEAFDSSTALIMAVDNPAYILKTTDGGNTWRTVFEKNRPGMFLDAMDFNGTQGLCIGDPMPGPDSVQRFYMIYTLDQGNSWKEFQCPIPSSSGEAIFAASGSNIFFTRKPRSKAAFVTGGSTARLYLLSRSRGWFSSLPIPISNGKPSAGAFSMCASGKEIYITGGDYQEYWKDSGNVVYTTNAGKTWNRSSVRGYRSSIIRTGKKTFITCGTNGVDISFDGCRTWQAVYGEGGQYKNGFNVCAKSRTGNAVYFAGPGNIGILTN